MGKKDKKKTTEKKARVAAKQSKKANQKEKKNTRGKSGDDSDAEDVDLETVLEQYAAQQQQFLRITESLSEPPSARASGTLIASPSNAKELLFFGGESYRDTIATFFNDLFVYSIEKDEWKKVTSPNSPLPRSGHAWCRGGNAGGIYLFGGEFSSPKQGTFYHYNDFWHLEPSNKMWTRLETKGKGPSARSGHRMTYFKNYIILFGGFRDTSEQTTYLDDLWLYDCHGFAWYNPVLPPTLQKPDARSSFSLHPHESGAVLFGGYSRVKASAAVKKQGKGGSQLSKTVLKPTIHGDTWFLRITQPVKDGPSTVPQIRWERRKKPANSPNPARAGITQVFHKGRGILFGGVHDVEESEEGIESEFFDQLYAWNIERNRFFQLTLRRGRAATKTQGEERNKKGKARANEEELIRNLAILEQKGTINETDVMNMDVVDDEEKPARPSKPILDVMPHKRFNAQLAVQDDILYILGGTYEQGDREYTFDEMHAIDLGKLDGVQEIYRRELENWQVEGDDSESDSEEEKESDDEEMEGDVPAGVPLIRNEDVAKREATVEPSQLIAAAEEEEEEEPEPEAIDSRPHPRPFESLRAFFTRTSTAWQELTIEKVRDTRDAADQSIKELRKIAFEMAEVLWWDCREEISAEEARQEEAGIGEVVSLSLADRSKKEEGGLGRRR